MRECLRRSAVSETQCMEAHGMKPSESDADVKENISHFQMKDVQSFASVDESSD